MAGRDATELEALRHSVDQLTHGLKAMVETQATQTEMLRALLAAATAPADQDHRMARMLSRLTDLLTRHGNQLRTIGTALDQLPAEVGVSVARGVTSVVAAMTPVK